MPDAAITQKQTPNAVMATMALRPRCARLTAGARSCRIRPATAEKTYGMMSVSVAINTMKV
jgi:hypothetical protein